MQELQRRAVLCFEDISKSHTSDDLHDELKHFPYYKSSGCRIYNLTNAGVAKYGAEVWFVNEVNANPILKFKMITEDEAMNFMNSFLKR